MTFSLTVDGACETPLTLDWGALDSLAHGADLVADTAALSPKVRGQGVRLGAVLDLAQPLPTATHVMVHDDGEYRACLTLDEARARGGAGPSARRRAAAGRRTAGRRACSCRRARTPCMSVKRVVRAGAADAGGARHGAAADDAAADRLMAKASAGYSGTPLPQKLGIKPAGRVALVDAPKGFALDLAGGREARRRQGQGRRRASCGS